VIIHPSAVPTIPIVEEIKALGVTIRRRFSVAQHVNHLLVSCAHAQSLFAVRMHSLTSRLADRRSTIYTLFFRQATVVAKLSYASPAR